MLSFPPRSTLTGPCRSALLHCGPPPPQVKKRVRHTHTSLPSSYTIAQTRRKDLISFFVLCVSTRVPPVMEEDGRGTRCHVGRVRASPPYAPVRHFRATSDMVHYMDQTSGELADGEHYLLRGGARARDVHCRALEFERFFLGPLSIPLPASPKLGTTRTALRQVFPQSSCTSARSFQALLVCDRVAFLGYGSEGRWVCE